jgi:hypothetical protein
MNKVDIITVEDVRLFIQDDEIEANELEMDLSFSDKQILNAMVRAGREYNSIPPIGVGNVDPKRLPSDTNVFLDATAEQLYKSELANKTRKDVDYETGGVSVNIVAKRIKHLTGLISMHRGNWEPIARVIKLTRNINQGYRTFH